MKKIQLILVISFCSLTALYAQGITGATNVCLSTSYSYSATVSGGGIGAGSYKWYINGTWQKFAGASASATLTMPASGTSFSISVVYTPTTGSPETYYLTADVFSPGTAAINYTQVCYGSGVSVTLSGSFGSNLTWQKKEGAGAWTDISGGTPNPLSVAVYQNTSLRMKQAECGTTYSNEVAVTVDPASVGGTIYTSTSAICNSGTASISLTGQTGTITNWQVRSKDGTGAWSSWSVFSTSSSTSNTYAVSTGSGADRTYEFKATVTSGVCTTATSSSVAVLVNRTTAAGTITSSMPLEQYGVSSATLTLNGSVGSVLKWQKREGATVTDISNTTTSLAYTNITTTTEYRAVVQNGVCNVEYSPYVMVNIYPVPQITFDGPQHIALGGTTGMHTGSYYYYQWIKNGTDISGQTTSSITITEPAMYGLRVKQTSTSPTYTTGNAIIGEAIDHQLTPMNYVSSIDFLKEGINDATNLFTLTASQLRQQMQYSDGLGRVVQTVDIGASPLGKDIIQAIEYDSMGRNSKSYLPYSTSQRDGRYAPNALGDNGDQYQFYQNVSMVAHDAVPYSVTQFEKSPLSRPLKQFGTGSAWTSNNKFVGHAYLTNVHGTSTGQEKIIAWTITSDLPVRADTVYNYIVTGGYYATGQLSVKSTKDEEGKEVREYTDKLGHVILKKVQYVDTPTLSNKDHWAQTYYVYDVLGNLRFVLPPELTKKIFQSDSYNPTSTDLGNWAFQYKYDKRRRMIEKRVPGADAVYMVYDNRDRLILTQDANQRAGATNAIKYWSFTKYDELNRPILTGIKDTTTTTQLTQVQMQAVVDSYFAKTSARWSESYVGSSTGNVHGYTNKTYPVRTGSVSTEIDPHKYLTVTYYDDYSYKAILYDSATYSFVTNDLAGEQATNYFKQLKGLVTGTKIKVLDGGVRGGYTWLKSVNYYDDKNRVIQVVSDNYKGGTDRSTMVIDFAGKVLKTKSTQLESDITWKDKLGIALFGNRLTRTASGSTWATSGAASVQQLAAGQDGWMEVTVSEISSNKVAGFSDVNVNADITTIDYAFYQNAAVLKVYENGTSKATIAGALVPGEVLRIERTGTTIRYKRNGLLVYTSLVASNTLLMADVAINTASATVVGARTSFGNTSHVVIRRLTYDHTGRLLKTFHTLDGAAEVLLTQNVYNELGQLIDKKLYSTNGGTNFKQSVDYRYNIRGWLTKINESDVNINEAGDPRDLFGMELFYNQTDAGISNAQLFNGNISAMKWSKDQSIGTKKENAYNYSYDPLNRITAAAFKEKSASWAAAANNGFSESGYTYDQNGNIKTLLRYDKRGSTASLDNLVYDYGTTPSNKLLKVTDGGDDFGGFVDGTNTGSDYTYDVNGNMITDQNKGITTAITYNFLNLPETVTKGGTGGNSIKYMYDASGRKLAQVVTFNGSQKQTDYTGEFQYENDVLQFVGHEEGRVVMSSTQTVFTDDATVATNFTALNTTVSTLTQYGTEKYVKAVSTGTTAGSGVFPIGGTIPVTAGERYKIRARGYRDKGTAASSSAAYLLIKANGTSVDCPGSLLPAGTTTALTETWIEQTITIPAGATTLQAGVTWNTVLAGEAMYINDFEITKLTVNATPECQFNLKDHLGNVRVSFTTKTDIDTSTGTLETANATVEQSQYLRYNTAKRVNASIFDRTNGALAGYSERLNGSANEKYGLARSLSVMTGDTIKLEVYAKYIDPNSSNWTGALSTLVSQIAANTAGVVIDGSAYANSTASFPAGYGTAVSKTDNGAPRAYLNWLIFDRNFLFITGGFKQITTAAMEAGSDVAHEKVAPGSPIVITQAGYVYVYLSNEETSYTREVYFDDFKVTHIKSPVVSTDDYYPGGALFNSYVRENSVLNKYKYQSKELLTDLGLDLSDFGPRWYDPWRLQTTTHDPMAEKFYAWSPYSWAFGNPVRIIDPTGMVGEDVIGSFGQAITTFVNFILGNSESSEESASNAGRSHEVMEAVGAQAREAKAELKETVDQIPVLNVIGDLSSAQQSKTGSEMAGNLAHAAGNLLMTPTGGSGPKGAANPKVAAAIKTGNAAHADFKVKADAKGWTTNPRLTDPKTGKTVIPDAVTKSGKPVELKPNTASGQAKGAKQLPKYERATGEKGKVVYYDPNKK